MARTRLPVPHLELPTHNLTWPEPCGPPARAKPGRATENRWPPIHNTRNCHWRIGLAPRFFDLGRGELIFFRRFPFFFEQNPTLNRKKSFRCAKGRAFSFFSGRKKFFLSPKRASPTSSPYSPEVTYGILCLLRKELEPPRRENGSTRACAQNRLVLCSRD